jgi:hypothetical protein
MEVAFVLQGGKGRETGKKKKRLGKARLLGDTTVQCAGWLCWPAVSDSQLVSLYSSHLSPSTSQG